MEMATFLNWGGGEGTGGTAEACTVVRGDGKWGDIYCGRQYAYACEMEHSSSIVN